ncbi:MAG: class I SAM-dependent methyltransferase [Phycisphaerales bacterium JB040]
MTDWDKHDLYETCVQSVDHLAPLLRAIHGARPRILGEDFSGTAALSHAWVATDPEARAVATDLDDEALRKHPAHERVDTRLADVRDVADPCDVLFVGNFSIGYLHTRAELVEYLRHARSRLSGTPGGVFVCDTYGGETAWTVGDVHRPHSLGGGWVCRYTWEQSEADPLTGMVVNRIHFRVERAGVIEQEILDAFVYRWRLWSVPELRDAMADAGFRTTQVYAKLAEAVDDEGNAYTTPVTDPDELDGTFIVLVVGRAG